ncbi:MAG: hypothetical protein NC412_14115 [Roseburia sp.]|nr:hypothetical protein [Roseburia sp.]MCM1279871.1 hypothetical protein [Robinsoniella sp.]
MKINSSVIGMESTRTYTKVTQKKMTYSLAGQRRIGNLSTGLLGGQAGQDEDFKNLLNAKEEKSNRTSAGYGTYISSNRSVYSVTDVEDKKSMEAVKEQCVQYLIFWLFSARKTGKYQSFSQWQQENAKQQELAQTSEAGFLVSNMNTHVDIYERETEATSFSTTGTVVTADGRQLQFQLDMTMSRSFEAYYEENYTKEILQAVDPLVINLEGNIASVSDQKFEFDLDGDGILDTISRLEKGSGYLALDKNGDGRINDGSELFGTASGDGFEDLSRYDSDGNGWIDENDEIWGKLLIWTQDEKGKDQLYHLAEAGVGAICLKRVSTEFSLNSLKDNTTNGQIRKSGIFLYENGNVGTVQHLDLTR